MSADMDNPTPDQMTEMIEAIFTRADQLLDTHGLDQPGDQIGFNELMRLVFEGDQAGQAIFASMDEALLAVLFDMYQKRQISDQTH